MWKHPRAPGEGPTSRSAEHPGFIARPGVSPAVPGDAAAVARGGGTLCWMHSYCKRVQSCPKNLCLWGRWVLGFAPPGCRRAPSSKLGHPRAQHGPRAPLVTARCHQLWCDGEVTTVCPTPEPERGQFQDQDPPGGPPGGFRGRRSWDGWRGAIGSAPSPEQSGAHTVSPLLRAAGARWHSGTCAHPSPAVPAGMGTRPGVVAGDERSLLSPVQSWGLGTAGTAQP